MWPPSAVISARHWSAWTKWTCERMSIVWQQCSSQSLAYERQLQQCDALAGVRWRGPRFSIYILFFFFAFKYVLRFFVSYIYGTIIQNFNHTLFFEKNSPYVRAVREKHFDTLKPVLTHAHVLIEFIIKDFYMLGTLSRVIRQITLRHALSFRLSRMNVLSIVTWSFRSFTTWKRKIKMKHRWLM